MKTFLARLWDDCVGAMGNGARFRHACATSRLTACPELRGMALDLVPDTGHDARERSSIHTWVGHVKVDDSCMR
eukprot:5290075-Pyramimonas_sp.AAC.1